MTQKGWQRARKPEEKEVRRQAILTAARKLTAEVGPVELSLSELARRSGVSKPNIYRYFENREEVLLQVWIEELRTLGDELERAFTTTRSKSATTTVQIIAQRFAAQPRLCELMSIISPVLEPSLSKEAVLRAKQSIATLTLRIAALLHARMPMLTLEQCLWAAGATGVFVAGLWAPAHPTGVVAELMALPEMAPMKIEFARDLESFLHIMLAGLTVAKKLGH